MRLNVPFDQLFLNSWRYLLHFKFQSLNSPWLSNDLPFVVTVLSDKWLWDLPRTFFLLGFMVKKKKKKLLGFLNITLSKSWYFVPKQYLHHWRRDTNSASGIRQSYYSYSLVLPNTTLQKDIFLFRSKFSSSTYSCFFGRKTLSVYAELNFQNRRIGTNVKLFS